MIAGATKLQPSPDRPSVRVAAVVATCTRKKTRAPTARARAISIPAGSQASVETGWLSRLRSLTPATTARALYAGRGFRQADDAARLADAPIFAISAGLGLVAGTTPAPAYGITLEGKQADAVSARVRGPLDPSRWFEAMLDGPFSVRWADVLAGDGLVLIALTHPYARLAGTSLAVLGPAEQGRLRLFGRSLASALPDVLHPAIAPYDERLDAISPGLLQHFSSRALLHFVKVVLPTGPQGRAAEFAAVETSLAAVSAPERPRRPAKTDADIRDWLTKRLVTERGIARLLNVLRHEEGVACEQGRFTRLYRSVLAEQAAA